MTNTVKHTPGPWEYETVYNSGEGTFAITRWDEDQSHSQEICQLTRADSKRNGQDYCADGEEANARLIAAAPVLLDALISIEEYWNQDRNDDAMFDACWQAINTARAAITKATAA